jgi:hypothetical protein
MRILTIAATAAVVCATAATAFAAPARLSDVQYIAANRCLGLMSSKALGTPDAATLAAYLRIQGNGREGFVWDRADQARDEGRSDAGHGGAATIARLTAERDGLCHDFVAAAQVTADTARPAHSS